MITTAELKEHLGITDSSQDTYLTNLAARITAYVERYTGRVFGRSVTVTDEVHDYPKDGGTVLLRQTDVRTLTSLKYNDTAMDTAAYKWNAAGEINLPAYSSWDINWGTSRHGHNNALKITYTYGMVEVPLDVKLAALEIASTVYARRQGQGQKVAERIGDYSVQYADAAKAAGQLPDQLGILDSYRFKRV